MTSSEERTSAENQRTREPESSRPLHRVGTDGLLRPPSRRAEGTGGKQPVSVFAQILGRGCVAVTELLDTDPFVANLVLPKIKLFQRLGG